jgi:hypothetical protein
MKSVILMFLSLHLFSHVPTLRDISQLLKQQETNGLADVEGTSNIGMVAADVEGIGSLGTFSSCISIPACRFRLCALVLASS